MVSGLWFLWNQSMLHNQWSDLNTWSFQSLLVTANLNNGINLTVSYKTHALNEHPVHNIIHGPNENGFDTISWNSPSYHSDCQPAGSHKFISTITCVSILIFSPLPSLEKWTYLDLHSYSEIKFSSIFLIMSELATHLKFNFR